MIFYGGNKKKFNNGNCRFIVLYQFASSTFINDQLASVKIDAS
jgi:hypothetical protein